MNTIAEKSVNAGSYVTKSQMNDFTAAYKQQRWATNSDNLGRADSLSLWFTVDELEGFLEKVKANGGNGVRIHFGVYPQDHHKPELAGMQTLVLVANRSKDGSLENAKQILVNSNGTPDVVAMYGPLPCPPMCPIGPGGGSSLVVRKDNRMEVI